MNLMVRLIFVIVKPVFAAFLAIGAMIGVAASIIIMNLFMSYFTVASDSYTSLHPHVVVHGSWTPAEAEAMANRIAGMDPRIAMAAPALHFETTITLASVNVATGLCDSSAGPEASCSGKGDAARLARTYAYDVTDQRQAEVQVRGITISGSETVAGIAKLLSGKQELARLALDRDSGGNELATAFIAQDSLINDITGFYLIEPGSGLSNSYTRHYRLHDVVQLGTKSSGAPFLFLGMEFARRLAPSGKGDPNVIEIRLQAPLEAERVAADLRKSLPPGSRIETWVDKERAAFQFLNATWTMVFGIMLSICLVVGISIYSTLTLSILRNRWKVALLGAIGCTRLRIGLLFLAFAIGIGVIGISSGVLIGQYGSYYLGGVLYKATMNLSPDRFAATVTWWPAVWMALATLVIFIVSALLPARRAVAIRPAEGLRAQV